jgi:hydrogenase maturation factor
MELREDEIFVLSTDPITGTARDIGNLAIQITLNDLASAGAEPVGVMLTFLLPEKLSEAKLRGMMEQAAAAAAAANVQIMGGHTEVTNVVNQPVISVVGVGKAKKGRLISTAAARPGMDVIVTKWIGLEGTSIIAKEKEDDLLERYPKTLVDTAKGFDAYLSVLPEAAIAVENGVSAMHDVTEGGIFGALWEMAESSGVGLEVDLKKIPIRQETVEVCEYFDINPYELISSGSMLMAAADGNGLVRALLAGGIPAVCIGKVMPGNDRVVISGEERRFLEPPKADELYKVV